jgi:hypothetical protein
VPMELEACARVAARSPPARVLDVEDGVGGGADRVRGGFHRVQVALGTDFAHHLVRPCDEGFGLLSRRLMRSRGDAATQRAAGVRLK